MKNSPSTRNKICQYEKCIHAGRIIDSKSYKFVDGKYFHTDCYNKKVEDDICCVEKLWISELNKTVICPELYKVITQLIRERDISSGYIVFTVQYCIDHHWNLRYPQGLKYFLDKQEVKDAYEKKISPKIDMSQFKIIEPEDDDSPKFSVQEKVVGFESVLGGE